MISDGMLTDMYNIVRWMAENESNRGQMAKRLLAVVGWQMWKRTFKMPLVVRLFNNHRFLAYPDCQSSSSAIYYRIPNWKEIAFLGRHLKGGTMIDIGANVGLFTLLVANLVDHAILFEPNPQASQRIRENALLNDLSIEIHTVAVSDKNGEIFLENRGGTSSTNMTLNNPTMSSYPTERVPCMMLDDFLDEKRNFASRIAFVKIDVEGHENSVLRGMQKTMEKRRPEIVMFEYLQRTDFSETKRIFGEAEYKIFELNEKA